VGAQLIGEFKAHIAHYKSAQAKVQEERAKEANRFDTARLNQELQLIQTRVKLAMEGETNLLDAGNVPISARLQAVYDEAMQSGDIHRQRAAVEVLKATSAHGQERIAVNALAKSAERAERDLRQTEATRTAAQDLQGAADALEAKRAHLDKTSQLLGMGPVDDPFSMSPFAKAARLVGHEKGTQDNDGFHGGIVIYDEDSPEVTGVYWRERPLAPE
jgi:hypothetical protein